MNTMVTTLFFLSSIAVAMGQSRVLLEPPDGMVYHGVGQQQQGVAEYVATMEDSSRPRLGKLYFDIPGTRGQNYEVLRQMLLGERSAGRIPELSLGFHGRNGATDSVIATSTAHDAILDSLGAILRAFGSPVFLRPGFEFNGPWNGYRPYLYVTAYRKAVDRIRAAGADSLATVWCYYPTGASSDFDSVDRRGARWYPGDAYVDWFGLDLFKVSDFDLSLPDSARGTITSKGKSERFLAMARSKGRPVLLSETSATFVDITSDSLDGERDWYAWYVPFFAYIDAHPEIKGFMYINWDWRAYDTWKEWGNSRIDSSAVITARYREEMRRPKYIHAPFATTTATPDVIAAPTALAVGASVRDGTLMIDVSSTAGGPAVVQVIDARGRDVLRQRVELRHGSTAIHADIDELPSGMYHVLVNAGGTVASTRVGNVH